MPAPTTNPVGAALRSALAKPKSDSSNENGTLDVELAGAARRALLADVEFESTGSYQTTVLDKLKNKYIVLKSPETPQPSKPEEITDGEGSLKKPKYELFPLEQVQLGWNDNEWPVGGGMVNMGNSCYLNSILQALFHVPALVNWLVSDAEHAAKCYDSGICMICAMRKTFLDAQKNTTNSFRPQLIFNKLRNLSENLVPGEQEDAHEFLRHLVESMERAYLRRFKNFMEFDSKVKETTPLNQILGGYLRSTVKCLKCGHISITFQHFQDLLLDIKKAQTLDEALELYFSREKLDDSSYQCESCLKKVPATKQFFVERAPMVLCVQLKRFSLHSKITKHISFRQRLDLTKFARLRPNIPLIYRLVALVTHIGPTVSCGHYTAVAQGPSGIFYQYDDSTVRPISHQAVFNTNAYIMLYELESSPFPKKSATATKINMSKDPKPPKSAPPKMYGPELPPKNGNNKIDSPPASESDSDDTGRKANGTRTPVGEITSIATQPSTPKSLTSSSSLSSPETMLKVTAKSTKSLVPYESDDTCSSEDSVQSPNETKSRVSSKAALGEWQITSSTIVAQEPSSAGKSWEKPGEGSQVSASSTVNELFKMSHSGYSTPIPTWQGTRSQLSKEVNNEKRKERKRAATDNLDQSRAKQPKANSNYKSNPGYNPIQEYHSNWNQNNGHFKSYYGNRHRNFNNRNYSKKYKNNFRYRQ